MYNHGTYMAKETSQHESHFLTDLKSAIRLFRLGGVNRRFFGTAVVLSVMLTLFSTYTIGLLFPLVQGIVHGDYSRIERIPLIAHIVEWFPVVFETTTAVLVLLIVAIYITTLCKNTLQYFSYRYAQQQSRQATVTLRDVLLAKCLQFGKSFYDTHRIAWIQNMFIRLSILFERQFRQLQKITAQLILMLIYVVIMFFISWQLTLVLLVIFPISSFVIQRAVGNIRRIAQEAEAHTVEMGNMLLNILQCFPVVKGFGKERYEQDRFAQSNKEEAERMFHMRRLINLIEPIEDVGITTASLLVALTMALLLNAGYAIPAAHLIIYFYLALQVLKTTHHMNSFKLMLAQSRGVMDDVEKVLYESEQHLIPSGDTPMHTFSDNIRFSHVSFTYPETKRRILQDVSFEIKKGQTVAIVGPTGAGKSTILQLLLRLYDCEPDAIFIDGVDIRSYDIASLRQKISFVYQDALLFNTSVAHNVAYAVDEAVSDEALDEALQQAELSTLLSEKTGGISDGAQTVSGGEKKLITLARALMKEHDILLLDEVSSALDAKTEERILDMLKREAAGKTVIVIAHRLATITHADHIMYIDKGAVIEQGTHEELLAKKGAYFEQWTQQMATNAGAE